MERSHLSELGGKFAGIVSSPCDEDRADALRAALSPPRVSSTCRARRVRARSGEAVTPTTPGTCVSSRIGNDRPGIVGACFPVV